MRRYSDKERAEILHRLKSTNLTQREFAARMGVNYHTLKYWAQDRPTKRKRPTQQTRKAKAPCFVEVQSTGPMADPIRLRIAPGLELSLSELPPPEFLAKLAGAMQL